MTVIAPLTRFSCGGATIGLPALTAAAIVLAETPVPAAYMPWPDAQGDLVWEGGQFGITAAEAGANVTGVSVTVTYRVSDPAAFSSVTGRLYSGGSPITSPQELPYSAVYQTQTITLTTGLDPSLLPGLSLRLRFHQTAMGFAIVNHALAMASWAYADNIGIASIGCEAAVEAPGVHVYPPAAQLASAGAPAANLAPAFGRPTRLGSSLVAWVCSNAGTASLDIACHGGGWVLEGFQGGEFNWTACFVKQRCKAGETPPTFTTSGGVTLCQLLEVSGVAGLDYAASSFNTEGPLVSVEAGAADAASGDLILGIGLWGSVNLGGAVGSLSGTDSSGAALPLAVSGAQPGGGANVYALGWAQASPAAGPGLTALSGDDSVYSFGALYLLAFKPAFTPAPRSPRSGVIAGGIL
jgi:hypothetical protein